MRKIYSVMVAVMASTMVVSAASRERSVASPKSVDSACFEIAKGVKGVANVKTEAIRKAAAKAAPASIDELVGTYTWNYVDLVQTRARAVEVTIEADAAVENGIVIPNLFGYSLKGTYDASTGIITLPCQTVGYNEKIKEDIVFSNVAYDAGAEGLISENGVPDSGSVFLTYDANDDCFASSQAYCFVGKDKSGYTAGWYELSNMTVVVRQTPPAPPTPWKSLGMAKANLDYFFPAVFSHYPGEIEVAIEQSPNEGEEGVYRLVSPWDKAFGRELNSYLEFDMSNPDCVVIHGQATGVTASVYGAAYVQNMAGSFLDWGFTLDEYINGIPDPDPNFAIEPAPKDEISTYDAATRTVNIPLHSAYTYFNGTVDIFAVIEPTEDYTPVPAYIILPETAAVDDITVSDENAPVEYYNLQGIRVTDPVKGGLYIRRQGGKTVKVIK